MEERTGKELVDFSTAEINDWIEGVGDITTEYEKNFIRRYGQREATIRNATLDTLIATLWTDHIIHPDSAEGRYMKMLVKSLRKEQP